MNPCRGPNDVATASADRIVIGGEKSTGSQDSFALARLAGDTKVALAEINDSSAQRSRVTSLTVRFSCQVTFSGSTEQAFTLVRTGGGAVNFTAFVIVQNAGTIVTLDNFSGTDAQFGSSGDGRYTLTARAAKRS
jgi:hypothetical protein